MPLRRHRSLEVLLLVIAAVAVMVFFTDWPPWTVILGGISLAVGAVALLPARTGPVGKIVVGRIPALAPAFQQRTGVQKEILDARAAGHDIVLHGTGGTGTTQLAVAAAQEAVRSGTDLVVWVDAAAPSSVVTAFALAAYQVDAPGVTGADGSVDAHALVGWLRETDHTWLIVFDGVTDAADLDPWWPAGHPETGWILATTTPATDPTLSVVGLGRATAVAVGPYTAAEAHEYLTDCGLADEDADELAAELDHHPLALYRAAVYLRTERLACRDYLNRWVDQRKTVFDPAEAAVLLALAAVQRSGPAGQALPVLRLAAEFDPAGQPAVVWKSPAVAGYLAGYGAKSRDAALRVVAALKRHGLAEYDGRLGAWTVRMHPGTAHAVRKNTPDDLRDAAARTAADAVLDVWPDDDAYPGNAELVQVLRANAHFLARLDGDPLWRPEPHELLWRAGISLERAELHAAAIAYWKHLVGVGERVSGPRHQGTLIAVGRLATSLRGAGRNAGAVAAYERVVDGLSAVHGSDHEQTLDAVESLAIAYLADERTDDAVKTATRLVSDRVAGHGDGDERTVKARWILATSYRLSGHPAAAVVELERVVDGYAALRGPDHPDTQGVREILAAVREEAAEE
jgi:hypothetical protein